MLDETLEGSRAQVATKPWLWVGRCGCSSWETSEPGGRNGCQDSTPVSPVGIMLVEGFLDAADT